MSKLTSRLEVKFILLVACLMLGGSTVAVWVATTQISKAVRENLIQRAMNVAVSMAESVTFLLDSSGRTGDALDRTRGDQALRNQLRELAQRAIASDPYIDYLTIVNREGRSVIHTALEREGRLFNDPVGTAAARTTRTLVQEYPRDTGQLMYDVAVPLIVGGNHWGAIRVGVDTKAISAASGLVLQPLIVLALAGTLAGIGLVTAVVRRVVAPLKELAAASRAVAEGDLTRSVAVRTRDEVGQVAQAFNHMVKTLNGLVSTTVQAGNRMAEQSQQLSSATSQSHIALEEIAEGLQTIQTGAYEQETQIHATASAMSQLTAVIDQIARGAEQQSTNVSEISDLLRQTAQAVELIASDADQLLKAVELSAEAAHSGGEELRRVIQGIKEVQEIVNAAAAQIQALEEHSSHITRMAEMISDIADQTSLLSLNAAIEAARAGHQGQGFAVVADEVRKLADRSSQATREIEALVERIRRDTNHSVELMRRSAAQANEHAEAASLAGAALQKILGHIVASRDQIQRIAQAASQAAEQGREVTRAVESVSAITEENAAATEEMAASATQVSQSMERIRDAAVKQRELTENVSAAAEEVSASVQEVSRAARDLAEEGRRLQEAGTRFRV